MTDDVPIRASGGLEFLDAEALSAAKEEKGSGCDLPRRP